MCGIAGLYGNFGSADKEKAIASLSVSLAHRGPDGNGRFQDEDAALVHTRLSIIDLSENGNQPFFNESKSLVLICNGEIYNYQPLRAELIKKGHHFTSTSDSEVILHLYEEHQDDPMKLLSRLTGMFAFALWDTGRKRLFIARDRIGIKPLYYSYAGGRLIFSSEVLPIIKTGLTDSAIDHTSLYEYFLTGSVPGPNTIYAEVKCVEPGHFLIAEDGRLTDEEYWDIPAGVKKWQDEAEVLDAVDNLLREVVKDHLVADVPVGTFLSAGVDSSLITAMAVEHHPGIHSFTASFPGEPEDEGTMAADTAKKLGTTHHSYELTSNFFSDFELQYKDMDQPFAISSALSLGRIAKVARQLVKVVLSGDGADELFGGYFRHELPQRPSFLKYIPKGIRSIALSAGAKLTGKESLVRLRDNLALTEGEKFLAKMAIAKPAGVLALFSPGIAAQIDTKRLVKRLNSLIERRKQHDELSRILYVDMKTTLVDEMLTKCDRMTMINGVEGRVPFLDHRVVELAFSIPSIYKRRDGVGKVILRQLLAKKLGSELAYRKKTGFNSPLQNWLATDKAMTERVKKEFRSAGKLQFLNGQTMATYEASPESISAGFVFSIVCLNYFLRDENTDTH